MKGETLIVMIMGREYGEVHFTREYGDVHFTREYEDVHFTRKFGRVPKPVLTGSTSSLVRHGLKVSVPRLVVGRNNYIPVNIHKKSYHVPVMFWYRNH